MFSSKTSLYVAQDSAEVVEKRRVWREKEEKRQEEVLQQFRGWFTEFAKAVSSGGCLEAVVGGAERGHPGRALGQDARGHSEGLWARV